VLTFLDCECELLGDRAAVEVPGLLMRLNLSTRKFHVDVDEPWLALLRPSATIADYSDVLVRTYGLVAPFESACRYSPGLAGLETFTQINRAGRIAQDLLALGLRPGQIASIPTCSSISMFRGTEEVLGWLYVIERASLMHEGVLRYVLRNLPEVEHACSYLRTRESRAADHWLAFGRVLDRGCTRPQASSEIMSATRVAFTTCVDWLQRKTATRSAG